MAIKDAISYGENSIITSWLVELIGFVNEQILTLQLDVRIRQLARSLHSRGLSPPHNLRISMVAACRISG